MITYILFIIGFVLFIQGADLLVDGSASIAKKIKISSIVIGLTIVAFGTSAPEFIVNIFASAQGNSEIAIGNILGSNIANILLILGISAIIYPITTKKNTALKEIPLSLLAIIVLGIMANDMFIDGIEENDDIKTYSYPSAILFIILGLAGLIVGGKWIVDGAVKIAELFNVSQSLIGLTIVAIGTSR